jgi:hypothetical protein
MPVPSHLIKNLHWFSTTKSKKHTQPYFPSSFPVHSSHYLKLIESKRKYSQLQGEGPKQLHGDRDEVKDPW